MDWSPLWLSLRVSTWATLWTVLLGLLIAYPLARWRFPGRYAAAGLVNLPLVLPPTVLGYALLVMLGRHSIIGAFYQNITHKPLSFTPQAAIIAACVGSMPLFIGHARLALAAIDPDVVGAAKTDGANGWAVVRYILLPLAMPGLIAGTTMAYARALGDFGTTLLFASDTPHLTQTMPLAIYDALSEGDGHTVQVYVFISIAISLIVCLLASRLAPRPD